MSDLRAEYERETGKSLSELKIAYGWLDYVRWLERRAACTEQLAEACRNPLAHQLRAAALAAYEATKEQS